jgi:defect-in-organelle-trafficking protein DotC
MKRHTLLVLLSGVALVACAPQAQGPSHLTPASIGLNDDLRIGPPPPSSPGQVRISMATEDREPEIAPIRVNALTEGAQAYGSQMGYARRSWEILRRMEDRSGQLSEVFEFARVVERAPVRAGVVIPPVVSRNFQAYDLDAEGREASVADEYLTIIRPGRLAPMEPTWRDYLVLDPGTPDEPARSLLPGTDGEHEIFTAAFEAGWEAGVDLADTEFANRLARLQRDYTGMLQYRRLVAHGMMDRMVLEDADFGVTGGGNEMRIGNRNVRITSDAEFRANPDQWDIATVTQRDAMIVATGEIPSIMEHLPASRPILPAK